MVLHELEEAVFDPAEQVLSAFGSFIRQKEGKSGFLLTHLLLTFYYFYRLMGAFRENERCDRSKNR